MAARQEFLDWWSKNFPFTCIDAPECGAALAAWNYMEEKFNSAAQSGPTNTTQAAIALVRKLAEYYLTISSEYRTFNCFLETIEQRAAVR